MENVPRKHSAYESAKAADVLGDERPNADALGVEWPNEMLSSAKAADALGERLNADADRVLGDIQVVVSMQMRIAFSAISRS